MQKNSSKKEQNVAKFEMEKLHKRRRKVVEKYQKSCEKVPEK